MKCYDETITVTTIHAVELAGTHELKRRRVGYLATITRGTKKPNTIRTSRRRDAKAEAFAWARAERVRVFVALARARVAEYTAQTIENSEMREVCVGLAGRYEIGSSSDIVHNECARSSYSHVLCVNRQETLTIQRHNVPALTFCAHDYKSRRAMIHAVWLWWRAHRAEFAGREVVL